MLVNPFSLLTFLKVSTLKSTILILFILLVKTNLLRLKGGLIGGLFALILISGIVVSTSVAAGSLIYAFKIKNDNKSNNDVDVEDKLEAVSI